jgi:outer membrane protein assembly factor BamB
VMQGYLYYQEPYGNGGGGGDYVAVDIRTGQELWRINCSATGISLVPSFGYLPSFDSGNQHGVLPNGLLIASYNGGSALGTCWRGYDPRTGVLTSMNVTNVPSGTVQAATLAASTGSAVSIAGLTGELLIYTLTNCGSSTNVKYYLSQWNSSNVIGSNSNFTPMNWYSGTVNASSPSSYDWNISIPSLGGSTPWNVYRDAYYNDILIAIQGSLGTGPRALETGCNLTAISLDPTTRGQVLWQKSYTQAPNNETRQIIAVDNIARTFITEDKETLQLNGFSLADGSLLWTTTRPVAEWDTVREDTLCAYGNLYCAGFDGILYCYDDKTGNLLWTYGNGGAGNSTYAGLETSYGHYPIFVDVIAEGKVYLGTTEHSPNSPWYKGSEYRCINATDGTEIWTLTGWGTGMYVGQYDVVADGYFAYLNCYDMQVYSVGKGPSETTVSASPSVSPMGSSVMIQGTVIDTAAGTKQTEQATRFPNGVPAISDQNMGAWMAYVYMQKPKPTNASGVPVTLSIVDSNGNYRQIGTVTSDSDGFYSLNWKPNIPGKYTLYASFDGSQSYWPSHSETAFAIDAAATTPAPTVTPIADIATNANLMTIMAVGVIAIIVAIAVVGLLLLRKHA